MMAEIGLSEMRELMFEALRRQDHTQNLNLQGEVAAVAVEGGLFAITPDPSSSVTVGNIQINIDGDPTRYPHDTYDTALGLGIHSEDVKIATTRVLPQYSVATLPDLNVRVRGSQGWGLDDALGTFFSRVDIHLGRPFWNQTYVELIVIALPLIVLILTLVFLLSRGPETRMSEFVAALAVVAVTFLLLRPVVVPSSLAVITSVDYSLALAALAIVVLPTVAFVISRRNITPNGAAKRDQRIPAENGDRSADLATEAHNQRDSRRLLGLLLLAGLALLARKRRAPN